MHITLFDVDINKYGNSWIAVFEVALGWRGRSLFMVEWTSSKKIQIIEVLFIRFYF